MARLRYFAAWVKRVSRDPKHVAPPTDVGDCALRAWLRGRGGECGVAWRTITCA